MIDWSASGEGRYPEANKTFLLTGARRATSRQASRPDFGSQFY